MLTLFWFYSLTATFICQTFYRSSFNTCHSFEYHPGTQSALPLRCRRSRPPAHPAALQFACWSSFPLSHRPTRSPAYPHSHLIHTGQADDNLGNEVKLLHIINLRRTSKREIIKYAILGKIQHVVYCLLLSYECVCIWSSVRVVCVRLCV